MVEIGLSFGFWIWAGSVYQKIYSEKHSAKPTLTFLSVMTAPEATMPVQEVSSGGSFSCIW